MPTVKLIVENAKTETQMDTLAYTCMGAAQNVLKDMSLDENLWVWENSKGRQVITRDKGDEALVFVRELRPEVQKKGKSYINAKPREACRV